MAADIWNLKCASMPIQDFRPTAAITVAIATMLAALILAACFTVRKHLIMLGLCVGVICVFPVSTIAALLMCMIYALGDRSGAGVICIIYAKSPSLVWSIMAPLMCIIYDLGDCSGAHISPAATKEQPQKPRSVAAAVGPMSGTHCVTVPPGSNNSSLTDALVLSCGHDLCLDCASNALRQTAALNGRVVRCLLCGGATELCAKAADVQAGANGAMDNRATSSMDLALPSGDVGAGVAPVVSHSNGWLNGVPYPNPAAAPPKPVLPAVQQDPHGQRRGHPDAAMWQFGRKALGDAAAGGSPPNGFGFDICGCVSAPASGANIRTQASPYNSRMQNRTDSTSMLWNPIPMMPVKGCPCAEHPGEPAAYFCAICESTCICAECFVHGVHRDHDVLNVRRAHEALRARADSLLDEALALEDDFAIASDRLARRRKDVERATARGRARVRGAFARVRAQLADREVELLVKLKSLTKLQGCGSWTDSCEASGRNGLVQPAVLQERYKLPSTTIKLSTDLNRHIAPMKQHGRDRKLSAASTIFERVRSRVVLAASMFPILKLAMSCFAICPARYAQRFRHKS